MPDFGNIVGTLAGYRDTQTVDVSGGDWTPPNGACHIYVIGTPSQAVSYRTLNGTVDQTYTIPAGGTGGMIRLGDSLPVMVRVVRQTGTNATTIQAGIL